MLDYEGVKAKVTIVGVEAVKDQDATATIGEESLNLTLESNGTTLELRYVNNKSITIFGEEEQGPNTSSPSPSSSSAVLSVHSSLDADGANTAVFNIALDDIQAARALRDGIAQATSAMLLRLEDALSEACAEAVAPTLLVYDVSGPGASARDKLSRALKKLGCKATFVESWSAALEALQEDQGAAGAAGNTSTYAAFLCDVEPEGGWSRIEAGGERGTSGWDVARTLRQLASDDAGAADAEGGAGGGGVTEPGAGAAGRTGAAASILRRCKTSVPVIGIGTMNGDETAKDPRAATVPVSSVICHCEEAGMLGYVQKPLTAPKLRTVLTGIVPGVRRLLPGEVQEDEEELEDEEHLDEALEDWHRTGGWISKMAMVPFRVSRFALKRCRSFLPLWMVHILGNAFGVHFKNK